MELNKITISDEFKKTTPRREKIDIAKDYYLKTGELKKKILVWDDGELIDGYTRYLALCELRVCSTPVTIRYRKYVYGYNCEDPNKKEYVWQLVKGDVHVGDVIKARCWDKNEFKDKPKDIVVKRVTHEKPSCRTKLKDCYK